MATSQGSFMAGATYYHRSTNESYRMVERGGGRVVMEREADGSILPLDESELDATFRTTPDADEGERESGDGEGVVRLEDRGGAGKLEVKARAGLVPGGLDVEAGRGMARASFRLPLDGCCSICGGTDCVHISGEPDGLRVVRVQRVASGAWHVVFKDGTWIEMWCGDEDGLEPVYDPRSRGRGGVVSEQAIIRAKAAVVAVIRGDYWMEEGEEGMFVMGAPGGRVKGLGECNQGDGGLTADEKVRAFYEEAVESADLGAALRGESPWAVVCGRCGGSGVDPDRGDGMDSPLIRTCVGCGGSGKVARVRGRPRFVGVLDDAGFGMPADVAEGGSPTKATAQALQVVDGRRKEDAAKESDVSDPSSNDIDNVKSGEEKLANPFGRLRPEFLVEGVVHEEAGRWIVGFGDGTMAMVTLQGPEGTYEVGGWPKGTEIQDHQGELALEAVRLYREDEPFVQLCYVNRGGYSQEWKVYLPIEGILVGVARGPSGPGAPDGLFVNMEDIEESSAVEDDEEEFARVRDRALAAVGQWIVKHDSFDKGVDAAELMEFVDDPRTAAGQLGSMTQADFKAWYAEHKRQQREAQERERQEEEERVLADWLHFKLDFSPKPDTVLATELGIVLKEGPHYRIKYVRGFYRVYLSPHCVETYAGSEVRLVRNGDVLWKAQVPSVRMKVTPLQKYEAEHGPQVRAVRQGGGGTIGSHGFTDWHVDFHDGTTVWVRERLEGGERTLRCPTNGGPGADSDEPGNEGVSVLSKYAPVAERVVKAEIDWMGENVKVNKRGEHFEVVVLFGESGSRRYEFEWDGGGWSCMAESDPGDKSGWRDRAKAILERWLRERYRVEYEEHCGPDDPHMLIVWTDRGPISVTVTPTKDGGRQYHTPNALSQRWESRKEQAAVNRRIEQAVNAFLDGSSEHVKGIEAELRKKVEEGQMVEVTDELRDRAKQISSAALGMGYYPVERAVDEPGEDPKRFHRYRVATEEGMIFVRAQWAKVGDEWRAVAYDFVEDLEGGGITPKDVRKRVIESIQNYIKAMGIAMDHVKAWDQQVAEYAAQNKPIEVPVGRKRVFPTLKEPKISNERAASDEEPLGAVKLMEQERRCPHDGGACHHDCEPGECFREKGGMALSSPHDGYPLIPEGWVEFELGGANVGHPDDYEVYLEEWRMTAGRDRDYVFHRRGQNDWVLAVDPCVAETLPEGRREATIRIYHVQGDSKREVMGLAWTMRPFAHTDHCKKRQQWGDGECECGAEKLKYVDIQKPGGIPEPATVCISTTFYPEPEKTEPTLRGLESRIENLERYVEMQEDDEEEDEEDEGDDLNIVLASVHERLGKLEAAIAQHDSKAFGRMEDVAQMDGRVRKAEKGIAAHEEWLSGLERRFAEAAVSGGEKASRALLKTVLDSLKELESTTSAQKDLGSALSKHMGEVLPRVEAISEKLMEVEKLANEMTWMVEDVRPASHRHDRMLTDIGWQVAKLIEIVVWDGQLKDIAKQPGSRNLVEKVGKLFTWTNSLSRQLSEFQQIQMELARRIGWKVNPIPSMFTLEGEPILEAYEVGTRVGFSGNSTMRGVVIAKRRAHGGRGGEERCVEWQDMNGPAKGWHSVDDLYELDGAEEEIPILRCLPGKRVWQAGRPDSIGLVVSSRKGQSGEERLVRWNTAAGQNEVWHHIDQLIEMPPDEAEVDKLTTWRGPLKDYVEVEVAGAKPGEPNANGDIFPGATFEVKVTGRYIAPICSMGQEIVELRKGTYSLMVGHRAEPETRVPCGVGVIVLKELSGNQTVLLGQRKGAHGAGEWSFPGGRIEPGEDPAACAVRELEEETGISIVSRRLTIWEPCPFNNTVTGGQPWVTLFYLVHWNDDGIPKVMEPDKCSEWDFFSVENLPEPLFEAAAECARQSGWTIRSEVDHCSDE